MLPILLQPDYGEEAKFISIRFWLAKYYESTSQPAHIPLPAKTCDSEVSGSYAIFETKKFETFFCFGKICFEIPKRFFQKLFFVSKKNVSKYGLKSLRAFFLS